MRFMRSLVSLASYLAVELLEPRNGLGFSFVDFEGYRSTMLTAATSAHPSSPFRTSSKAFESPIPLVHS